jgi:hypothetical protein
MLFIFINLINYSCTRSLLVEQIKLSYLELTYQHRKWKGWCTLIYFLFLGKKIGMNSCIEGFVVPNRSPKYVNDIVPIWQPSVPARISVLSLATLMDTRKDLVKLTRRLVYVIKDWSKHFRKNYLAWIDIILNASSA